MTMDEFIHPNSEITSENGKKIQAVVKRLVQEGKLTLPKSYKQLFSNVAKPSSAAGILQFSGPEAEISLGQFCREELNLSVTSNVAIAAKLESELPAFWPTLAQIKEENMTTFLPTDVSCIVLKLLKIRKETFT